MASKRITILVVPEGSKSVGQFRIPKSLMCFLIFFLISCSTLLSWIIRDYKAIRARMPRLAQLERENAQQRKQFAHLSQRIDHMTAKMGELKEVDRRLKIMVNLETEEDNTAFGGVGGSDPSLFRPDYSIVRNHQEQVRVMHRSLDNLRDEIALLKREKTQLHEFLDSQKKLLASTPSIWPTKGWLSSRFGHRDSPFTGLKEFHKGIDISTRMNAPIIAPADGFVFSVTWDHGFGKTVIIKHGYGVVTIFAHLQKSLVKRGQYVKRGQKIAQVGSTGRSTGPHLHYEIHLNGMPVDPLRYILN